MASSRSGIAGFNDRGGMNSPLSSRMVTVPVLSPGNARRPVAISYSTLPNEKRSVRASSLAPVACSGDI
jgi:hypothetical protein